MTRVPQKKGACMRDVYEVLETERAGGVEAETRS
jgi:hypothetical protein